MYRYELSGTLHGMLRVRGFTQDDSHIFCTRDQVVAKVGGVIDFAIHMADVFGYRFEAYLGTKPEKAIGSDEVWEGDRQAQAGAGERDLPYKIDEGRAHSTVPRSTSSGWMRWAARGRAHDPGRLQSAERFDVNYVGEDGDVTAWR